MLQTVFRQETTLSISIGEMDYLAADGQVLERWANDGDNDYIHEDGLDKVEILTEYSLIGVRVNSEDRTGTG